MRTSIKYAIIGIALIITTCMMHELAHYEIYRSYGISSQVKPLRFITVPDQQQARTNCNSDCELAHNINETVGYHLIPLEVLVFFGLLGIIITKENET